MFGTLSQTWRTVGIDHRGTGATVASTENVTVAQMADDLLAVLDAMEIEDCVLAAESSGVAVALTAAQQQPERFTGLVLSGGCIFDHRPMRLMPFWRGYSRTMKRLSNSSSPTACPKRMAQPFTNGPRKY